MTTHANPAATEPAPTPTARRRLALRRESLRELTIADLGRIAGGISNNGGRTGICSGISVTRN
jgi:hypothetical protein